MAARNKTRETSADVNEFLATVEDKVKRQDCFDLIEIMQGITDSPPKMWGSSMVGFGRYPYKYDSGREGHHFLSGFAPRKRDLTIYVMQGFGQHQDLLDQIGKHKTGKCCLYVKRLDVIDRDILKQLIKRSVTYMKNTYT